MRRIYAEGDSFIILFDAAATAADGHPYRNTYAWFLTMSGGRVQKATAFVDTRDFDEPWGRVSLA